MDVRFGACPISLFLQSMICCTHSITLQACSLKIMIISAYFDCSYQTCWLQYNRRNFNVKIEVWVEGKSKVFFKKGNKIVMKRQFSITSNFQLDRSVPFPPQFWSFLSLIISSVVTMHWRQYINSYHKPLLKVVKMLYDNIM